jgi:predicted O-methyltransferase YrrM
VQDPRDVAKSAYIAGMRSARALARRTGVMGRLDESFRQRPTSAAGHLRSLLAIYDVEDMVALDVPWWTYGATAVVERQLERLDGGARVFEYGSGASSVWLGRRAGRVHSVEHHAGFARVVRTLIAEKGLQETVQVIEVEAPASDRPEVSSRRRGEARRDYADYVSAIDRTEGEFDLVVVDGRARLACLAAAVPRLAPGGLILFDDSQRGRYAQGLEASGLRVERFRGWAPAMPYPRESAVLRAA